MIHALAASVLVSIASPAPDATPDPLFMFYVRNSVARRAELISCASHPQANGGDVAPEDPARCSAAFRAQEYIQQQLNRTKKS